MKRPAYQHYPGDWHACVELQGCSLAARGLWIEMLGLMHLGEPYGTLTAKGKDMGRKDILIGYLACWTGIERKDVEAAFSELEAAEVFSYTEQGIAFSRRMVRDEETRQKRANGGVESLNNPNVPRPKGILKGSPSKQEVKVVQSVEEEDEVEVPKVLPLKVKISDETADDQMAAKAIQEANGFRGDFIFRDLTACVRDIRTKENVSHQEAIERFNFRWKKASEDPKVKVKFWIQDGFHLKGGTSGPKFYPGGFAAARAEGKL